MYWDICLCPFYETRSSLLYIVPSWNSNMKPLALLMINLLKKPNITYFYFCFTNFDFRAKFCSFPLHTRGGSYLDGILCYFLFTPTKKDVVAHKCMKYRGLICFMRRNIEIWCSSHMTSAKNGEVQTHPPSLVS